MTTFIKPIAQVTGRDSNVFVTLGICTQALRKAGYRDKADECSDRTLKAESYDKALQVMMEYCELE